MLSALTNVKLGSLAFFFFGVHSLNPSVHFTFSVCVSPHQHTPGDQFTRRGWWLPGGREEWERQTRGGKKDTLEIT